MNKHQDELVKNYQALKKKPRSEEALTLLRRLASQVKPILKFRNWTIKNLCEFFPTNPNLLGNAISNEMSRKIANPSLSYIKGSM